MRIFIAVSVVILSLVGCGGSSKPTSTPTTMPVPDGIDTSDVSEVEEPTSNDDDIGSADADTTETIEEQPVDLDRDESIQDDDGYEDDSGDDDDDDDEID